MLYIGLLWDALKRRGYTFINPAYLSTSTNGDIQAMFTDTNSFLMRVRKMDETQPYIVLSQLAQNEYVRCEALLYYWL